MSEPSTSPKTTFARSGMTVSHDVAVEFNLTQLNPSWVGLFPANRSARMIAATF
jgi:hypothetical protein